MRFSGSITIPPLTPRSAPAEAKLAVDVGTIVQVTIQVPPGPAGLAGVRLLYTRHQIVPLTPEEWMAGDADMFTIPESYPIAADPLELIIQGYNDDDLYEHTITVHVDMLRDDPAGTKAQMGILARIAELLGLGG